MPEAENKELTLHGISASPGICIGQAYLVDKEGVDIIGPENNKFLQAPAMVGASVVLAWGNHGHFLNRGEEVLKWYSKPMLLKETKSGQPAHPLMLPYSLELHPRS